MQAVVNLDPDVEAMLRRKVREQNLNFDEALNETLRSGLSSEGSKPAGRVAEKTYSCGSPLVDLTKALALADEIGDQETVRKMRLFPGR